MTSETTTVPSETIRLVIRWGSCSAKVAAYALKVMPVGTIETGMLKICWLVSSELTIIQYTGKSRIIVMTSAITSNRMALTEMVRPRRLP